MKVSYDAEEIASEIELLGEGEIKRRMLLEYQEALNDRSIRFVGDVPQYLNTTEIRESKSNTYLMEGMPDIEFKTGNHIKAITRGDSSDPDERNFVIPEDGFFNAFGLVKKALT